MNHVESSRSPPQGAGECGAQRRGLDPSAERQAPISGSYEWVPSSGFVAWSDALAAVFGVSPSEFRGTIEAFVDDVHPDDRQRVRETVASIIEKRPGSFAFEHRICRHDGEIRILSTRGDLIAHDGAPVRYAGACWDITEERLHGLTLEDSVSLLHSTLQATVDGILVVDRSGVITAHNERFVAMWRIPHELAGRRNDTALLEYVLDQLTEPAAFLDRVQELYENPERESFDVVRFNDGRVFERYSRPQRVRDAIVGRVWSFRDITERERLLMRQQFLLDASRLLVSLDLDAALDAVARRAFPYLGNACAIDLVDDPHPRRLLECSEDRANKVPEMLPPSVYEGSPKLFQFDNTSYVSVPLYSKEHRIGHMTFGATPPRQHTLGDLSVAEELGIRVSLALENARLLREARSALRARDEFLSIAAHEIRGPLAAIHLAVQTLRGHQVPELVRDRTMELIEREDRRLARFVSDLVDLGSIRTGRMHMELEDVDLAQVTRETVARLSADVARAHSKLIVHADQAVIGHWDRFRIEQIITNLLDNAIKFGLGKPIDVHVEFRDNAARLVVCDRGIGIPPEQRETIFQPFERGVSVRHYGGLGLGLFIVRTIVTRLGGSVRVEPRDGGGSQFTVQLPRGQ